ncbi:MAG: peptide-methionine (R)-S-oxide reductase MsrB [Flavobacteriales bacterium]|nr:peptide-methionine (R)-S-oxide reductase MsrB [Flavobacteriales bacterium]
MKALFPLFGIICLIFACSSSPSAEAKIHIPQRDSSITKLVLSENEWKARLSPQQFYVLRKKGTERAFTGQYESNKKKGDYYCAGCGHLLFSSNAKFDSGTGWPSFFQAANNYSVDEQEDRSGGGLRIEVVCAKCGGHLGHVFDDGPKPTGRRYCINSVSLQFKEKK